MAHSTEEKINEIHSGQKRLIDTSHKLLIDGIKDLNKELPKFRKGLEQVQKFEEERMSIGIEGVAKQRKSLLKSLRALPKRSRGVGE